jgi:putative Holliday junction resolvase
VDHPIRGAPDPQGLTTEGDTGPSLPVNGRIMAIDLGERRIGVAVSDPQQVLAQPLTTLSRRPGKRFPLRQLRPHIEQHDIVGFVIGLPLSPEGGEGTWSSAARGVGSLIWAKTGLPVEFWDERMTTSRALSAIAELGGRTRGRKGEIDQLAATVLLQTFLDSRKK